MVKNLLILLALFSLFPGRILHAQVIVDSTNLLSPTKSGNFITSEFSKELNIYNLRLFGNYVFENENFLIMTKNSFNSNLTKGRQSNIRDEENYFLSGYYKINNFVNPGFFAHSTTYSDSRETELNKTSSSYLAFYNPVNFENTFVLNPYAGYIIDKQAENSDEGFLWGFESSVNQFQIPGVLFSSTAKVRDENISPRKNIFRDIKVSAYSETGEEFNNLFNVRYFENSRDFYFTADSSITSIFNVKNNIQTRDERSIHIEDALTLSNFLSGAEFKLTGGIFSRLISRTIRYKNPSVNLSNQFDSEVEELKFDLSAEYFQVTDDFLIRSAILYSERDEKHKLINTQGLNPFFINSRNDEETAKNNFSTRLSVRFSGIYFLSEFSSLRLDFLQSKLKYDTPPLLNFDDRDELLTIAKLSYTLNFNSVLSGRAGLEYIQSRTNYLFAQRSANNNTSRSLKFFTGTVLKTNSVYNSVNCEVMANYIVYEYEDINPNFKSYSFRYALFSDSTFIKISERIQFQLTGYFKIAEQGELKWNAFTVSPLKDIYELYYKTGLSLYYSNFSCFSGFRYYSLDNFSFRKGEKNKDSGYKSVGPALEFFYSIANFMEVSLNGWYEFIESSSQISPGIASMSLNFKWIL